MFLEPDKPIEKHRINLPHWQQENTYVFVTWRLSDSLPESVVAKILHQRKDWEATHLKPWDVEAIKEYNRLFTTRFEKILDDCHGSCCLREPFIAKIIGDALLHFDEVRYVLDSFVVMPNHVHVLFHAAEGVRLENIIHTWKRFTAREINKVIGRTGMLWQAEYWDRLIRSQKHLDWTRNYIQKNPEKLRRETYLLWRRGLESINIESTQ